MKKITGLFLFASILMLASCTKEDLVERADNTTEMVNTATDYAEAENIFEEVYDLIGAAAQQVGELNGFTSPETAMPRTCGAAQIETSGAAIFPLTLTLDFTDGACTLSDGRMVSGTIRAVYTGRIWDAGNSFTITFTDFVVDGKTINGVKKVTNNGVNAMGQLNFGITVENGMVTYSDGTTLSYETNRTRTWIEGMDTNFENEGLAGIQDDVWEITGTASGLNRASNSYEVTVTTALRRAVNCRWLSAGTLELDTDALDNVLIIDYGDGTCDNEATATLGIIRRNFTMK